MVGKMKGAGIDLRLFHVSTCLYKIYVPFVEIFSFFSIKELLSIWCIYPKTVATRRATSFKCVEMFFLLSVKNFWSISYISPRP